MIKKKDEDIYTIDEYLSMPYKIILYSTGEAGDEAFFAEIIEIDGCCADGATPAAAYDALRKEMAIHLQLYLKNGITPPLPIKNNTVKVLVRMPANLKQRLTLIAKAENTSVNQYIVNKLSAV